MWVSWDEWWPIQTWLPLTSRLQAWPLAPLLTLNRNKRTLNREGQICTPVWTKIFPSITVLLCPLTSKSLKFHFLPSSCLFLCCLCVCVCVFKNHTLGNAGERQTVSLSCDVIRPVNLRRGSRHLRQRRAGRWSSPAESVPLIVLVFQERRSSVSIQVWVELCLRDIWEYPLRWLPARLPLFCDGPEVEEVVLDRRTHQKIKRGDE